VEFKLTIIFFFKLCFNSINNIIGWLPTVFIVKEFNSLIIWDCVKNNFFYFLLKLTLNQNCIINGEFEGGAAAEGAKIAPEPGRARVIRIGDLPALGGPGELIGYLALLERAKHAASARVREQAALIVFPTAAFIAVYEGRSGMSVRLQHAIHGTLLRSLARTNGQLTRLISAARLRGADSEGRALEAARGSQMVNLVEQPH